MIWHIYIPNLKPGQLLWVFRVNGPYEPENGTGLTLINYVDPYAKAIAGTIDWNDSLFGYEVRKPDEDLSFSQTDSAAFIPKAVVWSQFWLGRW